MRVSVTFLVSFAGAHVCPRGSISVYRKTGKSWHKSNPNLFLLLRSWVSWLLNGLVSMMTVMSLCGHQRLGCSPLCLFPLICHITTLLYFYLYFPFYFLQPKPHLNTWYIIKNHHPDQKICSTYKSPKISRLSGVVVPILLTVQEVTSSNPGLTTSATHLPV